MSMPPAHDACGAMRARPSTPRRSCAPAAGWPYRCRRALAYGAALILLMLLSVALALTLGARPVLA